MSELRINNITDRAGSSGPIIAGVSTVTSTSHMVMPSGPTEMRGGRGRAVFAGGSQQPSGSQWLNVMDKVEIATTGNATDFGDMDQGRYYNRAVSNSTRGLVLGRHVSNSYKNTIEFVQIMTTGNAIDFGDLTGTRQRIAASSNGHGGLG